MVTLRINGSHMSKFLHEDVRIIGRVEGANDGKQFTMVTTDEQRINCTVAPTVKVGPDVLGSKFVEIVGKPITAQSLEISAPSHTILALGNELDMEMANSLTLLWHHPQVRDCFGIA